MRRRACLLATMGLGLVLLGSRAVAGPPRSLTLVRDLPLPGRCSRFDYLSIDPERSRLFLSHMGDGHLLVLDTQRRTVVADLEGFPDVTGVLAVPELGRVYVSVPGRRDLAILDEMSLQVLARVPTGRFPDGIAYASGAKRVFVSDESRGVETVVDAVNNSVVASLDLGGEAGNSQYSRGSGHILVALQTRRELVEIDPKALTIVARHPLGIGRGPHGLLVDDPDGLAFVACEDDAKLLVVGLKDFGIRQALATGDDPDVLTWDPRAGRLYVGCESGVISVFELKQGTLAKREDASFGGNCHVVAWDPAGRLLYVPLEDLNGHPDLRIMAPVLGNKGF